MVYYISNILCGCGSVVEHRLAKARVASSNLVIRSNSCLQRSYFDQIEIRPKSIITKLRLGLQASTDTFVSWSFF